MPKRGFCSACGYSWRLLKDGTVQHHVLWYSISERRTCPGSYYPGRADAPIWQVKRSEGRKER